MGEEDEGTGIDAQEDLGDCRDGDDRIVGRKRPRDPERTGSSDQSGSASSNASEGQEDPQEIEGEDANGARGLAEGETRRRRSARQMIREAAEQRRSQSEKELLHAAGDAVESIHGRDEVEEIPISAAVVAAKSDVLRTMILSKMKESQKEAPIVVKVTRRGELCDLPLCPWSISETGKEVPRCFSITASSARASVSHGFLVWLSLFTTSHLAQVW